MGKKKIEKFERIENMNKRNVTYCKRKKGILKKAMELSALCNQHIFMVIFDHAKNRYIEFKSHDEFNLQVIMALQTKAFSERLRIEKFTKEHYPKFEQAPLHVGVSFNSSQNVLKQVLKEITNQNTTPTLGNKRIRLDYLDEGFMQEPAPKRQRADEWLI